MKKSERPVFVVSLLASKSLRSQFCYVNLGGDAMVPSLIPLIPYTGHGAVDHIEPALWVYSWYTVLDFKVFKNQLKIREK